MILSAIEDLGGISADSFSTKDAQTLISCVYKQLCDKSITFEDILGQIKCVSKLKKVKVKEDTKLSGKNNKFLFSGRTTTVLTSFKFLQA